MNNFEDFTNSERVGSILVGNVIKGGIQVESNRDSGYIRIKFEDPTCICVLAPGSHIENCLLAAIPADGEVVTRTNAKLRWWQRWIMRAAGYRVITGKAEKRDVNLKDWSE